MTKKALKTEAAPAANDNFNTQELDTAADF